MDRETRKANLKKLQLPGTGGGEGSRQRKTRQNSKTTNGTTATPIISNYFLTPEKLSIPNAFEQTEDAALEPTNHEKVVEDSNKATTSLKPAPKNTRLKRTKLDTFLFKDPQNIPEDIKNGKKSLNDDDDDLVVPEKKIKKAPKLATTSGTQTKRAKSSKTKKQTTIKSAFLRNEQMFAEIAAQHCAADQFDGDDVQLALAISRSEAESKGIQCMGENDVEDVVDLVDNSKDPDLVREKLKKYGFRTAEKKDYNTFAAAFLPKAIGRRGKSKWANKFTALTLRNPELQTKKLQDNVQTLLNQQFRTKSLTEDEQKFCTYKLQSSLLKKCDMENKEKILQNLENSEKSNQQYFVTELFEINKLPPGHLLKDWTSIQGRDLTPNIKSQQSRERSIKLQNIYKDLEEYYSSKRRLDWTLDKDTKVKEAVNEDDALNDNVELNDGAINLNKKSTENDNEELDDMIALIEKIQEEDNSPVKTLEIMATNDVIKLTQMEKHFNNKEIENIIPPVKSIDIIEKSITIENPFIEKEKKTSEDVIDLMEESSDNDDSVACAKIKHILPPTKSLDIMQISSCTIRTEATINSTQKTRSNSPDLFADSDIEMEEEDGENEHIVEKDPEVIDTFKANNRNSSSEDIVGVTTYELYSSDEVKNISSLEVNKDTTNKEPQLSNSINNTLIDLTQDDIESPHQLNKSKPIVEMDLFAESPLQEGDEITDINSNSQQSKYIQETNEDTFKFTLSSETDDSKECSKEKAVKTKENSFRLSLSLETKQWEMEDDEDLVIREMGLNQTYTSFLNFQGSKKLETSFHKEINDNFKVSSKQKIVTTKDNSCQLSLRKQCDDVLGIEDEDLVLREMAMNQTSSSFLNFQGSKQLDVSFHKETNDNFKKSSKEKVLKPKDNSLTLGIEDEDLLLREIAMSQTSSSFLNFQGSKQLDVSSHKETNDNFKKSSKEKELKPKDNSLPCSLSVETKQCNDVLGIEDEDLVLCEIAMSQTSSSFLNFHGSKQLETSFHKETNDNFKKSSKEKLIRTKDNSFPFSLNVETKQCDVFEIEDDDYEDEIVLRDMVLNQTNTSFLNFQGSKQLESSFNKESAVSELETVKDSLTGNDTIFRELCNKYLQDATKPQNHFEQTDTYLRRSFTQPLPKMKTPQKMDNLTELTLDFGTTRENVKGTRKSNSFKAKTPQKTKYSNDFTLSKSQSYNDKSYNSIDLTQNDEDDDEMPQEEDDDDDCLILSDDEINYSIWQANKTANFKTSENSENEEDAVSIPDDCLNNEENHQDYIIDFPNNVDDAKYDYMESKESSDDLKIPKSLTTINKSCKSKSFDRSEFGILEEYSEPIDYTPSLCTPTKLLNDASFLNSPTEKSEPMKCFSNLHRSSQKFTDLLNSLDKKSPQHTDFNDLNDFDEFDKIVYHSPIRKSTLTKKPEGLEQLLTAEISFKESQDAPANKTPIKPMTSSSDVQEINLNNKTYTLRYSTSSKPDYTKMPESELLKQMYNFGIKPLKRKQAVKMLEYIYNQTHPLVIDDIDDGIQQDDIISLVDYDKPSTSKSCLKSLNKTISMSPKKPTSSSKSCQNLKTDSSVSLNKFSNVASSQSANKLLDKVADADRNILTLHDSCGIEMLRYSIDLKSELLDENYIMQTNVTKKTSRPLLPFHIAWYNLVCSNPKLHETILMYEPIDLQQIYLFLKGLGYRYDPKDLKIFFDLRCIIFRYDLQAAGSNNGKTKDNNRHVRKKQKTTKKIN